MKVWINRFLFVWLLGILSNSYIWAYYQAYDFNDSHRVRTEMEKGVTLQQILVDNILHVRKVEDNKTSYLLFWLEGKTRQKEKIHIDSIHIPFMVENLEKRGFRMGRLQCPSKDRDVIDRLRGMVDILQYIPSRSGRYRFPNAMGIVEVDQQEVNGTYQIKHLKQYSGMKIRDDVRYLKSKIQVIPDTMDVLWKAVDAEELISMKTDVVKAIMRDHRMFRLKQSQKQLPKTHWFMKLTADLSRWGFIDRKPSLTLSEAEKLFASKYDEMLALSNQKDSKGFASWILQNMAFLSHLSTLLENHTLDDEVSKLLFANLGYVDTSESTNVLADVFLNEDLDRTERFRAMMGLKSTSAPLDDVKLESLISYGLSSSDDMLQKASGMLLGTLAKERVDRVPQQYKKISDAISDAIVNSDDKTVALDAAGNMKESASDEIVTRVEDVFLNDLSSSNRLRSARALLDMKKTELEISDFKTVLDQEQNSEVQAQIIRSSTVARDFHSNSRYGEFLKGYASKHDIPKIERMAALDALKAQGFGKEEKEKKEIRAMMVGEEDRDISRKLRELYRR